MGWKRGAGVGSGRLKEEKEEEGVRSGGEWRWLSRGHFLQHIVL